MIVFLSESERFKIFTKFMKALKESEYRDIFMEKIREILEIA